MKPQFALALLVLFASLACSAQEYRKLEVSGEYSHLDFDSKSIAFASNSGLNGYNLGAQFKLAPQFGIVAEVGAQYGNDFRTFQAVIGPQVTFRRHNASIFAHALFGQGQNRIEVINPQTNKSRAVELGGGLDYNLSPKWAIRVMEADYLHTNTFGANQGSLKLSAGLVFRLDKFKGKEHKTKLP